MARPTFTAGFLFLLICAPILCPASGEAPLKATAVVERADLFVGESFTFQIQVSGSEHPERPDLSHVTNFMVEFRGGQQNSRSSVIIINGRVTKDVQEGYFFSYRLTPRRAGRLVIPSIAVSADGRSDHTEPVVINARSPVETDDFKLKLTLSKNHCYIGEPVTLTAIWYIGKDVKSFNFTLPLLSDDSFHFVNPDVDMKSGKKLYRIPLGNDKVVGEKGHGRIGTKDFATITFKKILIPKRSGNVTIEPATVACRALVGYKKRQSMFDDDFLSDFLNDDFFGQSRRGLYQTIVVPSNSLSLRISNLPEKGRSWNFAGHVGEYRIKASANPVEVSVGDPITLTITLSGPDYLKHVTLPPLNQQPRLAGDFKIPKERATAVVSSKSKIFTQTIRALNQGVKEIPSIELPYFDTQTKTYRMARTEPIPLIVKKTRLVTALDAEGIAEQVPLGSEIETWSKGIAFNYEDMSVIENQRSGPLSWFRSPLWMCLILCPPACYFFLFTGAGILRRRNKDPMKARARKAFGTLAKSLRAARGSSSVDNTCNMVQDAFRQYLGDKLCMPKGALTFNDVKDTLAARDVDPDTLDQLKVLFETCEASSYAGNTGISDAASLAEQGVRLSKDLEKKLK
ncbi:MAG: protein BatD [Deltaproteobacteria bacterium]|nr:protein BatD [Deltaproteobacteria bacterium]